MLPITLIVNNIDEKRQEILRYFHNSCDTFERLFDMLKNDEVFYQKSEITRHPMIFYFGHTATFFINKLILAKVIDKRINEDFESMFAVGVDEMSWDDLRKSAYKWPEVQEVREYRDKVRDIVENLILTLPLDSIIKQDDAMWIILMGIEHERIHIETSSVLHRQMPLEYIQSVDNFPICTVDNKVVQNTLVDIETENLTLGKSKQHHLYGWDNEYGTFNTTVDKFQTSKYLVSNYEFLEFVNDNGYENIDFWDKEGQKFLEITQAKYPTFWRKLDDGSFKYRTITQEIDMPYSWPVDVNALEAQAFCRWKSKKEDTSYTLPSEEQFYALYRRAKIEDIPKFDDEKANINLKHFASSCPVDIFKFYDLYDVVGNIWQWTRTPIYPYEGFEVHPVYDDFSVPTFDNKHNLLKGGSFISTGNEMMKYSRYAFRRHFYQHAGFRYVVGDEQIDIKIFTSQDEFIDNELVKHTQNNDIKEQFAYIEELLSSYSCEDVLEIGCSMGSGTAQLAKNFKNVAGVDTTARIIQEAEKFKKNDNIQFWQVDPCNMKPHFRDYDLIVVNNIFSRVYSPELLLKGLSNRLKRDGVLVVINEDTELSGLEIDFKQLQSKQIKNLEITLWKKL